MFSDYTIKTGDEFVINPEQRAFIRRIDLHDIRAYDSGGGITPNTFFTLRWKGNQVKGHNGSDVHIPATTNNPATLLGRPIGTEPFCVMYSDQTCSQNNHNHMEFELLDENGVPLVYESICIWFRIYFDQDVYYPETSVRRDFVQRTLLT